jgi:hypothetical protein
MGYRLFVGRQPRDIPEVKYRGYSIRYEFRTKWVAQVRRPGGYMIVKDGIIWATPEEGEAGLLERARARIDKEEDQRLVLD